MKELILLKSGEVVLKGLNRHNFEDVMIKNMKRRIEDLGAFRIWKKQSTLYVEPQSEDIDMDLLVSRLQTVFGIAALTRACIVEKNFEDICAKSREYLAETLEEARTFKVEAKRADKLFPMTSPEICRELGGQLLEEFPHLRVDVEHPDVTVTVEIRETAAYVHTNQLPGAGGMPVGTSGKAAMLLSGGIDSPVAGYMMAKRGLELIAIHFASPPYTSDRARQKVISLGEKLLPYTGKIRLFVVPFTEIQEQLRQRGPEDYFTLLMRRAMMRVAEAIAKREECGGLITGESLAQVASQTLPALACTDMVTELPVLRPLIGMDKEEIIRIARKIDTFDTSILPYEDCCTVFTPRHPKTKPRPAEVARIEEEMALEPELFQRAVDEAELVVLSRRHSGYREV
ncbi:tRNA uracil 4-sulfurtransferase ThiI [Angelakisella massiliensis]|uniref:tRNA uracil 4-sulfurtransferase ThiI n=1 Tax=Angelakisella massiliensis TaxID=1871018 RepID=UPI0008F9612F|nr:tRNA uracil 4-sulfurtransferase ThiI [Angelakisella massiliensis]